MCRARTWFSPVVAAVALLALACDSSGDGNAPPSPSPSPAASATHTPAPTQTRASTSTASPADTPTVAPAATPAPPPERAVVVRQGTSGRRSVALTFDAGSDSGYTRDILQTLREKGVRASFCITGRWAEAYPDELLAIAAEGHVLVNHSYDHRSFTGVSTGEPPLTPEERRLEFTRTETTVYRITNRSTQPYFRPPYGDTDATMQSDAAAAGYGYIVMWTVDSFGWNHASADQITSRVLSQAAPGAIVIMHVGSESQDAAALPAVIDGLAAQGYAFETIDELLR